MNIFNRTPKSPGSKTASARRTGPGPYLAGLVFVTALAGLGGAVLVRTAVEDAARAEDARHEQEMANAVAQGVAQRLQRERTALAALASAPQVAAALEAGMSLDPAVAAAFPGAVRLLLLPAGYDQVSPEAEPPVGYALLEMLRQTEASGNAPPAEVYLPGQAQAHVNLLQPVQQDGEVAGHLVLTYPQAYLVELVRGLTPGEEVALRQQGSVFAGRAAPDAQAVPVADSRWQLLYAPRPQDVDLPSLLMWAPLAAAVMVGLAGVVVIILMRRHMRQDAGEAVAVAPAAGMATSPPPAAVTVLPQRPTPAPRTAVPVEAATAMDLREENLPLDGLDIKEQSPEPAASAAVAATPAPVPAEPSAAMTPQVSIDPIILRAYDVRGIVGQALDADVVRQLGRAIGTEAAHAGQQEVVVARDGRLSSPDLATALIEGLVATGREVIDIGCVPTPVMNFATFHLGTGAGVMVTGSHNPRDYNGLKIVVGGRTLSGDAIQALGDRARAGDFVAGEGSVRRYDILGEYVDRVVQDVTLHRPLRIVVDAGNGVGGAVAPQVFRAMGCEVEELFCEVDGYFPNHHPDPTVPANLDALISLVRLQGADLGLAFDGDADRLGVVDAKGRIIWADRQLMLFARDVLSRHPGADIVFDVKCSSKLAELITEYAGVPVMWKTGHSLIKNKLKECNAPLGGELSGHIFFSDRWYGFDDAIYAGARLLEILAADPRSSTEVFAELPEGVTTPELRVDLQEGEAARIMAALGGRFEKAFKEARITTIDGLRADLPDGWGLVRASNTTPSLVFRFEGANKGALARIQALFREQVLAVRSDLAVPF